MSFNRGRRFALSVALTALTAGASTLTAQDCNLNGIPDTCDLACGEPGGPCDVEGCGALEDCNVNGLPDECEFTEGSALDFDGVDDWVRIPRPPLFEPTDELTIEAWIRADSIGSGNDSHIVLIVAPSAVRYTLSLKRSGVSKLALRIDGASDGPCRATDPTPASAYFGQWIHVAGVYSAAQNLCQLYVNGELRADGQASGTLQYSDFDLLIGNFFDGLIDEVRIWSVARSTDEINITKDASLLGTEPGLVGYWRFDEATGQTAFDSSSHAHHGTLGLDAEPEGDFRDPQWVADAAPFTESDCNGNEGLDECDIAEETSTDCNVNGTPDECEFGGASDCDGDGESDLCEFVRNGSSDCNANRLPDECESQEDCNDNGVQDLCDLAARESLDCNFNGVPDECDIASGTATDCQPNGVPDGCDIRSGDSLDIDFNRVPDDCQACAEIVPPSGPLASLMAVAINGQPIEPTNCATAIPGDLIEAEFFLSGWGPVIGDLRAYQVRILGRRGVISGQFGLVLPVGWDAPPIPDLCLSNQDCPPDLICRSGGCVGPSHNPAEGAFLDRTREDYVLAGLDVIQAIGTSTLDYTYFAVGVADEGVPDSGEARYAGTLLLEVSDDACGRFSFGFDAQDAIFIPGGFPDPFFPSTWPLFIETPGCDCNHNAVRDDEEISGGEAFDCDGDGVLDECEPDCNANGVPDDCDLADCAGDVWCEDCNSNGVPDECDIADGTLTDADGNGVPDSCFIPIPTVSRGDSSP